MDTDVVVIGAGLAGLQSARRLQRSGLAVHVLEKNDGVGGRVRTERIDGFQCDRGFQVLNSSYPAVRAWIDVKALGLQRFGAGVLVRTPEALQVLTHPLNRSGRDLGALRGGLLDLRDLRGLVRWLGPTLLRDTAASRATDDTTLAASLDSVGATGRLRREVLDTFLAGVLADSSGQSSANYVRLLVRSFALAIPGLPRDGMGALPEQMAASLIDPPRLRTAAQNLRETTAGVEVGTDSGTVRARAAVVAVGPEAIGTLTGQHDRATHGLTTWWFTAPEPPVAEPFLVLDASRPGGGPAGPVWNTAVVSNAAPSYAPPGRHLIEATTLLDRPDGMADEAAVRSDLARIYGTSTSGWEVVAHHVLPHALPVTPPPLVDRSPQRLSDRVFVCGDHRDTGSIQGALVSGDRAARGIAGVLGASPQPRVLR
ncbi:NAD(P)/FAD-dependent oxidoreductase [Brevibacterium daeguense]|uniref:NAD(P)/FAD-dependent oxidoreductase n=1 Tax=Brevibacterium daeguense TaxID=909936 RepID=A0ABP8EHJ0_9MICO|nr:FAD-dependent oxidoreductase [Brevibacterium daeguense]